MAVASIGRVVPAWQGPLLYVEYSWTWYKRSWRSTIVSSVVNPLLLLLSLGVGMSIFLGSNPKIAEFTGGVSYLVWLAPALMTTAALQTATFESTYPILANFQWVRIYQGINATPLSSRQIAGGTLLWIALRAFSVSAVFAVIATLLGAVHSWAVIPAVLCSTLGAMAFSVLVVAFAVTRVDKQPGFEVVFRLIMMPMMLFAGTYYPVETLPVWAKAIAWVTPLWHSTELSRGLSLGTLDPLSALGHLTYLVLLIVLGTWATMRLFVKELEK
ncbi:ABC transporter permease [Pseudonocardiaceae bacterium YIM PH 21723]|nr:ABC transporter permease [Pseudonocardiaceae bacterium YIM PH 21723]